MEELQDFEKDIVQWYLNNYPDISAGLKSQFLVAKVMQREFTSGAGVFLWLNMPDGVEPTNYPSKPTQLDGPLINSKELECGASVGLGFKGDGVIDYIEIWCHGGDYPHDRHPLDYDLLQQQINHIDLR